jgi:hypothetical protein
MIEVVSREKFYKDVAHESIHPAVPKDPRAPCAGSFASVVAPSRTTCSGGASSISSSNTAIMKMFRCIFAVCRRTDQCLNVLEQCLQIVRHNQQTVDSQRDELLLEFSDVPFYPLVPDPYDSLTPVELAAFGISPACVDDSDDDDDEEEEEAAVDDEEMEDDE